MTFTLRVPEHQDLKPRIIVFGVGGAGGNAVDNMILKNLEGANFVVANTDAQALEQSNETKRTKRNGNEMFKVYKKEIEVAGKKISLETGKVARQADGAIIATCGETVVLATVVGAQLQILKVMKFYMEKKILKIQVLF